MIEKSMSPYAPVRYRDHIWWRFARQAAQDGFVMPSGQIAGNLPDMIMSSLCMPMAQAAVAQFRDQPDGAAIATQLMAKTMEFRHWIPLAAQYELCGRQIFDLTDELVEMLQATDVGECTLEGWHAPFDAFFVRFGQQEGMKLPFDDDFEYLDGAFVGVTPWGDEPGDRRIKFGFTTVHKDGSGVEMPGSFLDLSPAEQKMPIMDGIAAAIARRVASMSAGDDAVTEGLTAVRKGMLEEGMDLMRQAVALLVNALFYIESSNDKQGDVQLEPGRDTPVEQVVAWGNARPEKRAKLRSRLTSEGYVLVRMLGKDVNPHGHARASGSVKTHWRRGHWRQQRMGPQLSLVERRWIKPTMVNPERPHDDLPGHIYAVGSAGDGSTRH